MSSAPAASLTMHDHDDNPARAPGRMTAHVAGAPLEELLPLLASGGAALAVAVNAALRTVVRRGRRRRP
jgi:hypothetical protein